MGVFGNLSSTDTNETIQALEAEIYPMLTRERDAVTFNPVIFARVKAVYDARDRLGLLYDLAQALTDLGLSIVTARVATYGERAVDAFYVRDAFGLKVTHETKLADIRKKLLALIVAADPVADAAQ